MNKNSVTVGLAQIAPAWLDRAAGTEKIVAWIDKAGSESCDLVVFGEALLPGYPFWVERTDGARFESALQKELYAHYAEQAVAPERGDLDPVREAARRNSCAVYLGTIERAVDRGGHSLYCSMVYIDKQGEIGSIHRKLMPTYEERLVWSPGDGHGLRTHSLGAFTVGGLNCWENWLPLPRAALYAAGEDLHVAIWPGSVRNTEDITRFIAKEGRSFVISVSGLMRRSDIGDDLPQANLLREKADDIMANGGSCLAAPNGDWVLEPEVDVESLRVAVLDHRAVLEARQNLDVVGHYSRPDVTSLHVNRTRQSTVTFED
ncbi:MAG: carbon-nitrogen hydrolase family protein [Pseudomonadota bacterium]